jgi:hypothetical protein
MVSLTNHQTRSDLRDYEERWEQAGARDARRQEPLSVVDNLDGDWKVERLSGPLPMPCVWKRIRGDRGTTRVLPTFGPKLPFRLEQREGHVALIYLGPLSFMVDDLRLETDGSWLGRANAAGVRYAWFSMVSMESRTKTTGS